MHSNEKILSPLNTQEASSPVTEQGNASEDDKGVAEVTTTAPTQSTWQQWYQAFLNVLPVYIAVHFAFIVTTIFSKLFILPDFSVKSLPLSTLWQAWNRWDTGIYIAMATHGYNTLPKAGFFPLYPLLIKGVAFLIPDPLLAGLIISNLAGLILLIVLYRLVQEDFDSAHAYRTVLYLSLFPAAFFLAAAYSESPFLCLTLLTFYHMRRGHWWLAGIFGFFACLTRLVGILMLLPFCYEYLRQQDFRLKSIRLDVLSFLLLPAGIGLFALYCYFRFHDSLAFAHVQHYFWGHELHFPGYGMWLSLKAIRHSPGFLSFQALRNILDLGADIFMFLLIVLSFFGTWKIPRHLWAYNIYAATVYLFLQLFPINNAFPIEAAARYMLEVFPAFIVLAGIGRNRWLNLNYLLISGALLFLLLTQFLLGHWITG